MNTPHASASTSFRIWYSNYQRTENRRSARLWCFSSAGIVALTGAAVWWVALHPAPKIATPSAAPPPAIAIDMSPIPAPTPAPPEEVPPGPQQVVTPAEQQPDPPKQVEAPPSPAPHPPVPVSKIKKNPVLKKKQVAVTQPAKPIPLQAPAAATTTAPPSSEAASSQSSSSSSPSAVSHFSNAPVTWQGDILARLERFKRYPAEALAARQEGTPTVYFVMDRHGHVLSARLHRSSGFTLLDEETLAVVRRAEPFPPPPEEIKGATVSLTVPIEFSVDDQ